MFRNFFKAAWRGLAKNKVSALLNITGLSVGVVVCLYCSYLAYTRVELR